MRLFWICLLVVILLPPVFGSPIPRETIPLSDSLVIEVSQGFYFMADKQGNIQLKDLTGDTPKIPFRPVDDKAWNKDIKSYWLHFYVVNNTGFDREWVFDFDNWAFVDFYYQGRSGFIQKRTGHLYPFSDRVYPVANNNYINVPIKNGQKIECLVRLKSQVLIGKIPANLNFKIAPRSLIDHEEAHSSKIIFAFLSLSTPQAMQDIFFLYLVGLILFQDGFLISI